MNDVCYYFWRLMQDAAAWTVGWFGRTKYKFTGKVLAILGLPFAMLRILAGKLSGRVEIPYFDLVITTKCSLRCPECSNLMQYYGKPNKWAYNIAVNDLMADVTKLLQAVNYIHTMTIIGGEPFLHPDLGKLLTFLGDTKAIGHLQIISNGMIKREDLMPVILRNSRKLSVLISDYKAAKDERQKLVELLKRYDIPHKILHSEYWRSYGNLKCRNRSKKELVQVFRQCRIPNCRSLLDGEFHLCPRSSSGTDLGLIPSNNRDFVSIRKDDDIKNVRQNLKNIMRMSEYITACNYCDNSMVFPLIKVTPGE